MNSNKKNKEEKSKKNEDFQKRPKNGILKKGEWLVIPHRRVKSVIPALPEKIRKIVFALFEDLEKNGFMLYNWHNFGKLAGQDDHYHCHLKKGKPTFVACWRTVSKIDKIIEVYYVGTHEKAPY